MRPKLFAVRVTGGRAPRSRRPKGYDGKKGFGAFIIEQAKAWGSSSAIASNAYKRLCKTVRIHRIYSGDVIHKQTMHPSERRIPYKMAFFQLRYRNTKVYIA